jgi:amyloid beta precursor protein binding protein 1
MQPSSSAKKYDRQLRIWGPHGQRALETSRVCVLGSGCTATEALKNLVLGGIAGFTVVDDAVVEASDLGGNFLLTSQDIGRNRASAVTPPLLELNDNVSGSFVEDSPLSLLESNPRFFSDFQIVLATQASQMEFSEHFVNELSAYITHFHELSVSQLLLLATDDRGCNDQA